METLHSINGVKLGVAAAEIRYKNRDDLVVMEINEGASVSGVFTQNAFCAAPVHIGRAHLAQGDIRYLVINSGNANACTGDQGVKDTAQTCESMAKLAGVKAQQVLPFSTGVIGEFLPMDNMLDGLPNAFSNLSPDGWQAAAQAIMTTDTQAKTASVQFEFDGQCFTVTGMAKGSGMIHPNMATMLSFIATDASIAQTVLDDLAKEAADASFNRITVDGDTSTNDACMLIATGANSSEQVTEVRGAFYEALKTKVIDIHIELAQQIIKDAEGATKFVTVEVNGGANAEECLAVAYSVAHSPLVKTALFASDPNWGRIVCAIGYADVKDLDAQVIDLWLDDVLVVEQGSRAASYTEAQGEEVMKKNSILIRIDLHRGSASEKIWTSDLSHEYVTINAEYRS